MGNGSTGHLYQLKRYWRSKNKIKLTKILRFSNQDILVIKHKVINQINTLKPRQNDRNFADEISKCILLNETFGL